jgi:hypothetical protein
VDRHGSTFIGAEHMIIEHLDFLGYDQTKLTSRGGLI